jgi:methyl coenzyme M reductase gamma subunit
MAKPVRLPSGKIKYAGRTFDGYNKPKRSDREGKKMMVLAKQGETVKLIHFGDSSYGHNYSPEARRSFKARHAKNIAKGRLSAAYWANKELWAGKGGSVKRPPK